MRHDDDTVRRILTSYRVWAVVGCSPDPSRPSHGVARFLRAHGYRVIPVNPTCDSLWGETCHPDLASIPRDEGVEVVDVFRRSEFAGGHVEEALAIGAKAVWFQLGVVNDAAAERARRHGLDFVQDRCPAIEIPRLGLAGSRA